MTEPVEDRIDHLDRFVELRRTADRRIRDDLIEHHRELARVLARRYRGRGEEVEDLEQVALLGLLKAVERFEPERGFAFSTFATPTITGELKRHFRDRWTVRVPRAVQEHVLELGHAVAELSQQLGRSPTVPELAAHTGRDPEVVLEAMEAGRAFHAVGLDALSAGEEDDTGPDARLGTEERGLPDVEQRLTAETLLARLGERDQEITRLRFFDGLTQSEIAARMGISQMHVSRLITRVLEQLRRIADLEPDDLET